MRRAVSLGSGLWAFAGKSGAVATGHFTDNQVALLLDLVDASRATEGRFLMVHVGEALMLRHEGFPDTYREFDYKDAAVLRDAGLLNVTYRGEGGVFYFVVSPSGLQAYGDWHRQMGDAAAVVEGDIRTLVESEGFRTRHPNAYDCWQEATNLLWAKDATDRVSDLGHHCREAMQEFADSLLANMNLQPEEADKQKTKNRIAQALEHAKASGKFGDATFGILDAMSAYWAALNQLVVRQEHSGTKEGEPPDWDDARDVVFQTLFVMYELDRNLT
jgi:hypothetical protein